MPTGSTVRWFEHVAPFQGSSASIIPVPFTANDKRHLSSVWVYFLDIASMYSGLSQVALCSKCFVEPSGAVSLHGHLNWVLQECLLYGLCIPSCHNRALIAVCSSIGGVDPWANYL